MARRFEMISANFTSRPSSDFVLMPASPACCCSGLGPDDARNPLADCRSQLVVAGPDPSTSCARSPA